MKRRHLLAVLLAAAALFGAWRLFGGSDEDKIRRQLERLAEVAGKIEGEQPVVAFAKAREISEAFTEKCSAADARSGEVIEGRDDIARVVAFVRESEAAAVVTFEDVQVQVVDEGHASATLRVAIAVADSSRSEHDGTRASLTWTKVGGKWLIDGVFVERPAS